MHECEDRRIGDDGMRMEEEVKFPLGEGNAMQHRTLYRSLPHILVIISPNPFAMRRRNAFARHDTWCASARCIKGASKSSIRIICASARRLIMLITFSSAATNFCAKATRIRVREIIVQYLNLRNNQVRFSVYLLPFVRKLYRVRKFYTLFYLFNYFISY